MAAAKDCLIAVLVVWPAQAAAACAAASAAPLPIPRARQAFVPRASADGANGAGPLAASGGNAVLPSSSGLLGGVPSSSGPLHPTPHYAGTRAWGGARPTFPSDCCYQCVLPMMPVPACACECPAWLLSVLTESVKAGAVGPSLF